MLLTSLFLVITMTVIAAGWEVPSDFPTIQAAIDSTAVINGDKITVSAGNHAGALITKSVEIKGADGAIIDSGPAHASGMVIGFRMLDGSNGATISHLTFEVDLPIISSLVIDDVTITQNTLKNPVQGITNWGGSRWEISHNSILGLKARNGGGIGIIVGVYNGGEVTENVISHNTISGILQVPATDGGGYNGTGIVLYSDFRWGRSGGELSLNRVVKNTVAMSANDLSGKGVDIVAYEMSESRDIVGTPVITANAIGFNNFRGTVLQIVLMPTSLDEVNDISRNLGENRGHGLAPKVFFE